MVFPFYISSRISPDASQNFITKTSTVRYTPPSIPSIPLVLRLKSAEELGERIDTAPDFPIFLIDPGRWANKPAIHPVSIVTWDLQRLQGKTPQIHWFIITPMKHWPFCGYLYLMNCWLQPHQPLNLWSTQISSFFSLWIPGVHPIPVDFANSGPCQMKSTFFSPIPCFNQASSQVALGQSDWTPKWNGLI